MLTFRIQINLLIKNTLLVLSFGFITSCAFKSNLTTFKKNKNVVIVGAMRQTMHEGKIAALISLDSLIGKKNLVGLGPMSYLNGEILLLDGIVYSSQVVDSSSMLVSQNKSVGAPFFVYTEVKKWKEIRLPGDINDLPSLESFLNKECKKFAQPYAFKLVGNIDSATTHIVNLPKGAIVSSPELAHQGMVHFKYDATEAILLGFYSTQHKAVFTHHDTFMHLHFISTDFSQMGHLEEVNFKASQMKLYIGQ